MVEQTELGNSKFAQLRQLNNHIKSNNISLGGNKKLKIYGTLSCTSGKRLKPENRVFFKDEADAIHSGYRPCGHCLREKYLNWKTLG
jgi:methylphosphotriester-DNA--protein-cysteine methyltransferase